MEQRKGREYRTGLAGDRGSVLRKGTGSHLPLPQRRQRPRGEGMCRARVGSATEKDDGAWALTRSVWMVPGPPGGRCGWGVVGGGQTAPRDELSETGRLF